MRYLLLLLLVGSAYASEEVSIEFAEDVNNKVTIPHAEASYHLSSLKVSHEEACVLALSSFYKEVNGEHQPIIKKMEARLQKLEKKQKHKSKVASLLQLTQYMKSTQSSMKESDSSEEEEKLRPFIEKLIFPAITDALQEQKNRAEHFEHTANNRVTKKTAALITGGATVVVALIGAAVTLTLQFSSC